MSLPHEVHIRRRGTAIVDSRKGILVVRNKGDRVFLLPGGSAKKGESRRSAAIRELREETGLVAKEVKYLFSYTTSLKPCGKQGNLCQTSHKVFLIRAAGEPKAKREIAEIRYYRRGSKIPLSRSTKEIIRKYLRQKRLMNIKRRVSAFLNLVK